MKKKDLILIGGILCIALAGFIGQKVLVPKEVKQVRITIGGELFGEYPLDQDTEIRIGDTNICRIEGGEAKMTWAECPDQICVAHAPIGSLPGSIVCLPNRVVIETILGDDAEKPEASDDLDIVVG